MGFRNYRIKNNIKLPHKNYTQSLKNFLKIKDKKNFKNYKVFDYRLEKQLIPKINMKNSSYHFF